MSVQAGQEGIAHVATTAVIPAVHDPALHGRMAAYNKQVIDRVAGLFGLHQNPEPPKDRGRPARKPDEMSEPEWERACETADSVVDLLKLAEKRAAKMPEEWRERKEDAFHDGLFALMLMLDPYWRPSK